jgi:hypothetical protein
MPLGLIARLRRHRRPAVMIAASLIAVQAFLAGLATAQAGILLTPNLGDVAGFAVICHGNGNAGSDNGSAPDPAATWHPCCLSCAAGAPPATLPEQLIVLRSGCFRASLSRAAYPVSVLIAPRAVRAGLSQAPPRLD